MELIKIDYNRKYARLAVDLWPFALERPDKGLDERANMVFHEVINMIQDVVKDYISSHWHFRGLRKWYGLGTYYITFVCLREDAPSLKAKIEQIIRKRVADAQIKASF